jgi:exodeoxyribonuclease VII small subunit
VPDDQSSGDRSDDGQSSGSTGASPHAASGPEQDDTLAVLTYEQARDELVDVVRRLEAGGVSLEESLALWERGEALATRCQQWLDGARRRLDEARSAGTGDDTSDD